MAKIGRPPIENPKKVRVEVRMTEADLEMLDFCCRETGRTRSEFFRQVILRRYRKLSALRRSPAE
ncbi:MAG: ribbon-helix-helix protein, CopG family [Christensenellales bacterium]|jgi:hypothetical protein